MGISTMPSPNDSIHSMIVWNTIIVAMAAKALIRSVLRYFGFRVAEPPYYGDTPIFSEHAITEQFLSQFKPMKFGSRAARRRGTEADTADCRVCLNTFEVNSVVNRLKCGHLFHRACVEKWLECERISCPLCRKRVVADNFDSMLWF